MSHFVVTVFDEDVEKSLAPFHEFECTGDDNEYVQNVDITEKAKLEYEKDTKKVYQDPEGVYHQRFTKEGDWDKRFWRKATDEEKAIFSKKAGLAGSSEHINGMYFYQTDWKDGKGYSVRVQSLPEGWNEVTVPTKTFDSFATFVENYYDISAVRYGEEPNYAKGKHKYGFMLLDENGEVTKVFDRTNPKARWDWYQIGGRWSGYFKLKPGATSGMLGEPGLQTMDKGYTPPTSDRADSCLKKDIDVEGMKDEAGARAAEAYDKYEKITAGLPLPLTWTEVQEKHRTGTGEDDIDWAAARNEYNGQPVKKALTEAKEYWLDPEDFACTRQEYIDRHRSHALPTLAIIKDGEWFERGKMGWWGVMLTDSGIAEWDKKFMEMFNALPDDTLITIVDCHT